MPQTQKYRVTAPDGHVITLTGPAGATDEEVMQQAMTLYRPQQSQMPDFSNVQSGSSTAQANRPGFIKDQLGQFVRSELGMATGIPKQLWETGHDVRNWVNDVRFRQVPDILTGKQNIFSTTNDPGSSPVGLGGFRPSPPPMTATGREFLQATSPEEQSGKNMGKMLAAGLAATATGGASLPAQIGVGGVTGAALTPESPYVGGTLGMTAPMIPAALTGIKGALPKALKDAASAKFDLLRAKLGQMPVDTGAADDVVARALEIKARGGGNLPTPMAKYLEEQAPVPAFRGTPLTAHRYPLTFAESRDFASNAGNKAISLAESQNVTPAMRAQLAKFAQALDDANKQVATQGGMQQVYDQAMKEWTQAKTREAIIAALKKWGTRVGIGAATGAGGVGAYQALSK